MNDFIAITPIRKGPKTRSLSGRAINALLIPFDVEGTHVLKGVFPAAAL